MQVDMPVLTVMVLGYVNFQGCQIMSPQPGKSPLPWRDSTP